MRTGRLLVVLGVLALVIAACGGGEELAEQIIESQGDGEIEIEENDGTVAVTIETEDGEDATATFGGGEVPDDFPVPVPSGGDVQAVMESPAGTTITIFYPASEFDSLLAFYEDWVNTVGGEVTTLTGPDLTNWSVQDGDQIYNVAVADNDTEASVAIIVTDT